MNNSNLYIDEQPVWIIALNNYQRSNLLWLLSLIGYYHDEPGLQLNESIPPFTFANNGDWVGELHHKLSYQYPYQSTYVPHPPNGVNNLIKSNVDLWVKSIIKEMPLADIIRLKQSSAHEVAEAYKQI